MFLKFFKIKSGKEEPGSIDYCLNNPTARIVRGDPNFVKWIIDHSPLGLRQRFIAGVINLLTKLDAMTEFELIEGFQLLMLAGRHESSMPLCIIGHEDKGKHEMHFVAPLFDLMAGKLVHPYIDQIDRYRFASWVERFALLHGLEYPGDRLRTKPAFEHLRLRNVDTEFLIEIWTLVHEWVEEGTVTCRDELSRKFAETKHQVLFDGQNGKPLQQPVILGPDGNPLRLSNSIYYRPDFGPDGPKPLDRSDDTAVKKRILELEEIIKKGMEFRAHNLIGRLFGVHEKRIVDMGKARRRLKQLIDQKIDQQRTRNVLWNKIKVENVFQNVTLIQHGTPLLPPAQKMVTDVEVAEHPVQVANVPDVDSLNADSKPQIGTADKSSPIGPPEAFPRQAQAEINDAMNEHNITTDPVTQPVPRMTRGRQRHGAEIDPPPL